jgi:hypothetical protein
MTILTTIPMQTDEGDDFDVDVTYDGNSDGTCTPLSATIDGKPCPLWVWEWLWGPYGQATLEADYQGVREYEKSEAAAYRQEAWEE